MCSERKSCLCSIFYSNSLCETRTFLTFLYCDACNEEGNNKNESSVTSNRLYESTGDFGD